MQGYKVTPEILTQAGVDCDTVAGDIDAELQALRGYVQELITLWQGVAPVSFAGMMERYDKDAISLNTALTGIAQALRVTAAQYAAGEDANNTVVSGIYDGARAPVTLNV